jgi:hypothetical protein
MRTPRDPIDAGHRYPAEIISYAVWLYFRFPLSRSVHCPDQGNDQHPAALTYINWSGPSRHSAHGRDPAYRLYFARLAGREGFELDDDILTVFERFEVLAAWLSAC